MKKSLIIALAIMAGAFCSTAQAGKKKDKKKKQETTECCAAPVKLVNGNDTLSYAAGQMMTNGLISYLKNQFDVDTAQMADFVRGFNEVVNAAETPAAKARMAGMQIANQLKQQMLPGIMKEFTDTPDTIVKEVLFRGFTDALLNDTTVKLAKPADELFRDLQQKNKDAKAEKLTAEGRRFLEENKLKEGVITTESGLQYKILVRGEGEVPQKSDKVKVHYEGRLIDGTVFDASSKHGTEPATFRADQVIKGWTEALTMMPVGSKWQLYIPQNLAYGERQAGQIPPYSTLIFDVELVGIEK
jgi:FKBP-type peptidyl-prolyl cis-trans isomerase FklB